MFHFVQAGIRAIREGRTHYSPNTGTAAIRNAICKKLKGMPHFLSGSILGNSRVRTTIAFYSAAF